MLIGVYVDDIVTVCKNDEEKDAFVTELDTGDLKDRVKDEGIMRWCLGINTRFDISIDVRHSSEGQFFARCAAARRWYNTVDDRRTAQHSCRVGVPAFFQQPTRRLWQARCAHQTDSGWHGTDGNECTPAKRVKHRPRNASDQQSANSPPVLH